MSARVGQTRWQLWAQFSGIVGCIVFFFGILTSFVVNFDPLFFIPAHLVLGTVFALVFLFGGGHKKVQGEQVRKVLGSYGGILLYSAVFFCLVVVLNFLGTQKEFFRFDSTGDKVYSLSPQTRQVIEGLAEPIVMRGFFLGGRASTEVENLATLIVRNFPGKIQWEIVDPEKKPQLVEKYGITEKNTVHLSFARDELNRSTKVTGAISEETLLNGILKLTRGAPKVLCALKGHDEGDLMSQADVGYSTLRSAIEGENINVHDLVLQPNQTIPTDCDALLVLGPKRKLLSHELELLKSYLDDGGGVVLVNEPNTTSDIADIIAPLGASVENNIIVDLVNNLYSGASLSLQPIVLDYAAHPVTKGFKQVVVFTTASSVVANKSPATGWKATELVKTSPQSWGEKNLELLFGDKPQALLEPNDEKGPLSVAVALERENNSNSRGTGHVVVFGDRDFVSNLYVLQYFNQDLFLNALNWVIGDEQSITLRAKTIKQSTQQLTGIQYNMLFLISAVFIPELLIVFGLSIWWMRRS